MIEARAQNENEIGTLTLPRPRALESWLLNCRRRICPNQVSLMWRTSTGVVRGVLVGDREGRRLCEYVNGCCASINTRVDSREYSAIGSIMLQSDNAASLDYGACSAQGEPRTIRELIITRCGVDLKKLPLLSS